jgi:excinuclease UvrABC ATPase subunit
LVKSGNTVIVIEHDMSVAAASDFVDVGPGAGEDGGRIVAAGHRRKSRPVRSVGRPAGGQFLHFDMIYPALGCDVRCN